MSPRLRLGHSPVGRQDLHGRASDDGKSRNDRNWLCAAIAVTVSGRDGCIASIRLDVRHRLGARDWLFRASENDFGLAVRFHTPRDHTLADPLLGRLQRPEEHVRIGDRQERVGARRIRVAAGDHAADERVLVLEREPHRARLVVGRRATEARSAGGSTQSPAWFDDRVRRAGAIPGEHRELRRRGVQRRHACCCRSA